MVKTDYIKVHGKVMLAANAQFYREQKCEIEQPTDEEIKAEFPEYRFEKPAEKPAPAPVMEAAPKPKRTYSRKATN